MYGQTISSAPLSDFKVDRTVYSIADKPFVEKSRRLQDWATLYGRNPKYTGIINEMDDAEELGFIKFKYYIPGNAGWLHYVLEEIAENVTTIEDINAIQCLYMNYGVMLSAFGNLLDYVENSFFYDTSVRNNVEDYGIKLAHDVLKQRGFYEPFVKIYKSGLANISTHIANMRECINKGKTDNGTVIFLNEDNLVTIIDFISSNITFVKEQLQSNIPKYRYLQNLIGQDELLEDKQEYKGGRISQEDFR